MILEATQISCHMMDHNSFNHSHTTEHLIYLMNAKECPSLRISVGISDSFVRLNFQTAIEFLKEDCCF